MKSAKLFSSFILPALAVFPAFALAANMFTIKDVVDKVKRYESAFSNSDDGPHMLFRSIVREQDASGVFWKVEYSAERNDQWPSIKLRIRPSGEINGGVSETVTESGVLHAWALLRYCEIAGSDLTTVTGFRSAPEDMSDDSLEEQKPLNPFEEEHTDLVHGIVCWTNAPICVTDSLIFEARTNRFASLIASADKIVVRKGGYICCSTNVDVQPIATIVTNAADIAAFNSLLRFYRSPYFSCACCGYPGIDWWVGDRKIVLSNVHHCRAIRWEGFSGDMLLVKESSDNLRAWLESHGVNVGR